MNSKMTIVLNRCSHCAVPLYDDDTLWVCPGSHKRPANETEDVDMETKSQLSLRFDGRDPSPTHSGPIGNAVPVRLRAGDGVVYFQSILHWGSDYTNKKGTRRTLHFGYRSFFNGFWPQVSLSSSPASANLTSTDTSL